MTTNNQISTWDPVAIRSEINGLVYDIQKARSIAVENASDDRELAAFFDPVLFSPKAEEFMSMLLDLKKRDLQPMDLFNIMRMARLRLAGSASFVGMRMFRDPCYVEDSLRILTGRKSDNIATLGEICMDRLDRLQ